MTLSNIDVVGRSTARPSVARHCDLHHQLQQAYEDRGRQRLVQHLARKLASAWHIRWSDAMLAPWLTREHCRDNGEALVRWVQQELETCDRDGSCPADGERSLFEMLSGSLGRALAGIEETQR